jgi:hypothetical protein
MRDTIAVAKLRVLGFVAFLSGKSTIEFLHSSKVKETIQEFIDSHENAKIVWSKEYIMLCSAEKAFKVF